MKEAKLYTVLPDFIATPDSMAIDPQGRLILACPNFDDEAKPGCIARITETADGVQVEKWFDVEPAGETGQARPMGIDFDSEGNLYICDNQAWDGKPENAGQGRILKVSFGADGMPEKTTVIAKHMEEPNGIKVLNGRIYVTQSKMSRADVPSGRPVTAVYCFMGDDENYEVTNTLSDKRIMIALEAKNTASGCGANGIAFDAEGNLYAGHFGDGEVWRMLLAENPPPREDWILTKERWAADKDEMASVDGMRFDEQGNLYVADFIGNGISKITPDGKVCRIAADGAFCHPCDVIPYHGKLVASCFANPGSPENQRPSVLCCVEL